MNYARNSSESSYPHLWHGLVGLWLPGVRTGGTGTNAVRDFSGRKNHGTMAGSMTTTDWILSNKLGPDGYGLEFDGSDDEVLIGQNAIYTPRALTVSTWANLVTVNARQCFGGVYDNTTNQRAWFFGTGFGSAHNNAIDFAVADSGTNVVIMRASFSDAGAWHNFVATYDGTDENGIRIFIDGAEQSLTQEAGTSISGPIHDGTTPLYIGRVTNQSSTACRIAAKMHDFRVYDRALTAREVQQIYAGASPSSQPVALATKAGGGVSGFGQALLIPGL